MYEPLVNIRAPFAPAIAAAEAPSALSRFAPGLGGLLLVVVGLVFIAIGWRLYRVLLVSFGVVALGSVVAWMTRSSGVFVMLALGVPVGIIGGLLSYRFERYGVFVLGGMASAAPVLASEIYFMSNHTMYFSAIAGFLVTGSLAVMFWKPAIILSMCVIGATLVERGVLVVMESLRPGLGLRVAVHHNLLICLVFLGLILVGILIQLQERSQAQAQGEA